MFLMFVRCKLKETWVEFIIFQYLTDQPTEHIAGMYCSNEPNWEKEVSAGYVHHIWMLLRRDFFALS